MCADTSIDFWRRDILVSQLVGVIGRRVAVKAYTCPECGFIERCVRRLHIYKELILKAPK